MVSIITNRSAMAMVDTMRGINREMTDTQSRVSSGLRVASATDDAAYWSITKTMASDNKALTAVVDALHLGAATLDVAYTGMQQAVELMSEFNAKLVAAREPGVDRDKINSELVEIRAQMRSVAESASFNGENWLVTDDGTIEPDREIVSSFTRATDGTVAVQTVKYTKGDFGNPTRLIDNASPGSMGILTQPATMSGWSVSMPNYVFMTGENAWPSAREMGVDATTTAAEIDEMIDGAEFMHKQLTQAAANLGAMTTQVNNQIEFVEDLMDASDRGIGRLRDANMNEESSRLKALQTREQLGLQTLSIANTNADNVISLFR